MAQAATNKIDMVGYPAYHKTLRVKVRKTHNEGLVAIAAIIHRHDNPEPLSTDDGYCLPKKKEHVLARIPVQRGKNEIIFYVFKTRADKELTVDFRMYYTPYHFEAGEKLEVDFYKQFVGLDPNDIHIVLDDPNDYSRYTYPEVFKVKGERQAMTVPEALKTCEEFIIAEEKRSHDGVGAKWHDKTTEPEFKKLYAALGLLRGYLGEKGVGVLGRVERNVSNYLTYLKNPRGNNSTMLYQGRDQILLDVKYVHNKARSRYNAVQRGEDTVNKPNLPR